MVSSSLGDNLSMLMILCVIRNLMMIKFTTRDISWERAVCISPVITMTNNPQSSQYRYTDTHVRQTGYRSGNSVSQKLDVTPDLARFQRNTKRINDCLQWDDFIQKMGFPSIVLLKSRH